MAATDHVDPVLHAVSDPRRRALFDRIAKSDGICVADLTRGSGVTQGAVSQHLKVLKSAGLVSGETRGRNVFYRAQPEGLAPLADWLGGYETFWRDRFADLRAVLKEIEE